MNDIFTLDSLIQVEEEIIIALVNLFFVGVNINIFSDSLIYELVKETIVHHNLDLM